MDSNNSTDDLTQDPTQDPTGQPQTDGYYGDDDMGDDELDLSFLDEKEDAKND